ncbi:MAG: N-acetyl-gamma-glutamyl-phosphate reductase [Lachnospiraceae bacterium]|nr:N-acetyl-gamma-glutamyl-phosphate reductase [Lachnospiraceae bacterium]
MTKVFIDGSSGTTGLRIHERLKERKDLDLIILPDELRKNNDAIRAALNESDISFLCLPDAAAAEAVSLLDNKQTIIIDTSTAHRTLDDWAYGFPEIKGLRNKILSSRRIANPGCHASGFISLVAPLIYNRLIDADTVLTCFSLTGYSGGGKKMIADYENPERNTLLDAPRMYGLSQAHKHLPEMKKIAGLEKAPVFCPVVGDFYSGMEVTVSLEAGQVKGGIQAVKEAYALYYDDSKGLVRFTEADDGDGFLSAGAFSGRDDMEVSVFGNDDRLILVSRFDNLGKGASGAAIQNMNIVMGIDEKTGLNC